MPNAYYKTALTGGAPNALDNIDAVTLGDGDIAMVFSDGVFRMYKLETGHTEEETSPHIIKPDQNALTKRWILHKNADD